MAKQRVKKGIDNPTDKDETTIEENEGGNNTSSTPEDSSASATEEKRDFIDSDSSDIAQSLTSILSVPTETVNTSEQSGESREDVLQGMSPTPRPQKEGSEGGGFSGFEDLGSDESSALFEDNELLAEIGVEMIDMMMTYGAMALAQDWDNEKKYSIKDARKKKLRDPLAKILESREVKTAPELVFAFMIVVSYSPIMISAVQERRAKKNNPKRKVNKPIQRATAVVTEPEEKEEEWKVGPSLADSIQEPSRDEEDAMAEMMAKMQPKKRSGRPVGGTDLKPRVALSDDDRKKQIQKAKALRKDGKSFSAIAKELNVSEGTATRWVRS